MEQKTIQTMFSSKSDKWSTPQAFYDELNKVHNFTLDPCCDEESKKCEKFFTEKDNGLQQSWRGETVFMNPPYGREIKKWLAKAHSESKNPNTKVVCLVPARTDTKYWHEHCMSADKLYLIKGRLKFGDSKNSAPFPSAIVVFDSESDRDSPEVTAMNSNGKPLWTLKVTKSEV